MSNTTTAPTTETEGYDYCPHCHSENRVGNIKRTGRYGLAITREMQCLDCDHREYHCQDCGDLIEGEMVEHDRLTYHRSCAPDEALYDEGPDYHFARR